MKNRFLLKLGIGSLTLGFLFAEAMALAPEERGLEIAREQDRRDLGSATSRRI